MSRYIETTRIVMDPQATLDRLRELVHETATAESNEHKADLADEFAELVEAMDNWIGGGGVLPQSWQREARS